MWRKKWTTYKFVSEPEAVLSVVDGTSVQIVVSLLWLKTVENGILEENKILEEKDEGK